MAGGAIFTAGGFAALAVGGYLQLPDRVATVEAEQGAAAVERDETRARLDSVVTVTGQILCVMIATQDSVRFGQWQDCVIPEPFRQPARRSP